MQVALTSTPEDANLPSTAFLKLYDRRYIDERTGRVERLCWNPDRESEAQRTARLIHKQHVRDDLTVPSPDSRSENGGVDAFVDPHDDYEWEHASPLSDAGVGQWEIERDFRARMRREFQTECQVYHRLYDLQGKCVPEFYGTATFAESSESPVGIHFDVFGILLQFVEGTGFDNIEPHSPLALCYPYIGEVAVTCFEKIISLGVLHGDVRLANIIISQDGHVFIIDFAMAILRQENESDEDWDEQVHCEQESLILKTFLDQQCLRDRTPLEPYAEGDDGFTSFNRFVRKGRVNWRKKYYHQISDFEQVEYREDEDGNESRYEFSNWELIADAAAERRLNLQNGRKLAMGETS